MTTKQLLDKKRNYGKILIEEFTLSKQHPTKLVNQLQRWEKEVHEIVDRYSKEEIDSNLLNWETRDIIRKVNVIFGQNPHIDLNERHPTLKIDVGKTTKLIVDELGRGILAPDFIKIDMDMQRITDTHEKQNQLLALGYKACYEKLSNQWHLKLLGTKCSPELAQDELLEWIMDNFEDLKQKGEKENKQINYFYSNKTKKHLTKIIKYDKIK